MRRRIRRRPALGRRHPDVLHRLGLYEGELRPRRGRVRRDESRLFRLGARTLGKNEEEIAPPAEVATVGELVAWLAGRGENYAYAFDKPQVIRVAIDRAHVACRRADRRGEGDRLLPADDRRLSNGRRARSGRGFRRSAEGRALTAGRRDVGALASFVGPVPRRRADASRRSRSSIIGHGGSRDRARRRRRRSALAALRRDGDPSPRPPPAGGPDRLRRRRGRPSRRSLRRRRNADGLP